MVAPPFVIRRGPGPIVATAIHAGHAKFEKVDFTRAVIEEMERKVSARRNSDPSLTNRQLATL